MQPRIPTPSSTSSKTTRTPRWNGILWPCTMATIPSRTKMNWKKNPLRLWVDRSRSGTSPTYWKSLNVRPGTRLRKSLPWDP